MLRQTFNQMPKELVEATETGSGRRVENSHTALSSDGAADSCDNGAPDFYQHLE